MNGANHQSGDSEFKVGLVTIDGAPLHTDVVRAEYVAQCIKIALSDYVEVADAYEIPDQLAEDDRTNFEKTDEMYTGRGASMHDRSTGTFENMGWDNVALF